MTSPLEIDELCPAPTEAPDPEVAPCDEAANPILSPFDHGDMKFDQCQHCQSVFHTILSVLLSLNNEHIIIFFPQKCQILDFQEQ